MKKISIPVVCLILAVSLIGCGQTQNNRDGANGVSTQSMNRAKTTINTYNNKVKTQTTHQNQREHQSVLTQHVRGVEGVKDSTILVDNNNIIVGLEVDKKADRKKVEESVRKVLLKDHNGQNIHITSDSKFHDRIRTLHTQMTTTDGHPVKSMANDIKILLDDIGKSINKTVNNTMK